MQSKLESAILLANRGFYVFPLQENSKLPLTGFRWRELSTRDEKAIEKWWQDNPSYNIGVDTGKSQLYVIDVDTKAGKQGEEYFRKLDKEFGFPETLRITTASGGYHLYYTATGLRNTASKLAPDIDTRGDGGYVLAPGSSIGDKYYTVAKDVSPAPLPAWVSEKLSEYKTENYNANRSKVFSIDDAGDIARAVRWLIESAELAIEGAGGDHLTFATAAQCREFGLTKETTLDLMLRHWNERCSPPWAADELEIKVDNAYRYASRPQGAASTHADFDIVTPLADSQIGPVFDVPDEYSIPPRDWVFGHMALRKKISVLIAPPGVGKSTLTLLMALSKATGRDLLGLMNKSKRGAVMIHNNEDDLEELKRRMVAQVKHYGIGRNEFFDNDAQGGEAKGMIYLGSGEHYSFKVATRSSQGPLIQSPEVQKIIERLIAVKAEWLIVDPFSETHPANENDNGEILEVAKIYRHIAQAANCAITLVHHDRKPDKSSAEGHIGNMHSARGASSLSGVARIMHTLHTMPERDAKKYGIEEERGLYVRLDSAKANMSLSTGEPVWFKRVSQRVGGVVGDPDSGESVGVLEPVILQPQSTTSRQSKKTWAEETLLQIIREMITGYTIKVEEPIRLPQQEVRQAFYARSDSNPKWALNTPTINNQGTTYKRTCEKLSGQRVLSYANDFITVHNIHIHSNPHPSTKEP